MTVVVLFALLAQHPNVAEQAAEARLRNEPNRALLLYQQAVRRDPKWAEGWWWFGTIQYSQQKWSECRESFRRFTALEPKTALGFGLLGVCEFRSGDYDRAIQHLERATELGLPNQESLTSEVRLAHIAALTKVENFERALFVLTIVARQSEPAPELVTLAGIAALRKPILASDLPPEDRELVIRTGRAMITAAQRNSVEAKRMLDEIAADFPKAPNVHYLYGAFLLGGDPNHGLAELSRELELDPDHLPALVTIAMEYLKRSEPAEAIPFAERAVKVAPGNFAARTAYGRALVESDKPAAGVRELEIAAKLAPDSPQVHHALAGAYTRLGRKQDAARARAEFARLRKLAESRSAP